MPLTATDAARHPCSVEDAVEHAADHVAVETGRVGMRRGVNHDGIGTAVLEGLADGLGDAFRSAMAAGLHHLDPGHVTALLSSAEISSCSVCERAAARRLGHDTVADLVAVYRATKAITGTSERG